MHQPTILLDVVRGAAKRFPYAVIRDVDVPTDIGSMPGLNIGVPVAYTSGRTPDMAHIVVIESGPGILQMTRLPLAQMKVQHWAFSQDVLPVVQGFLMVANQLFPGADCRLSGSTLDTTCLSDCNNISEDIMRDRLLAFLQFSTDVEARLRSASNGDLKPMMDIINPV